MPRRRLYCNSSQTAPAASLLVRARRHRRRHQQCWRLLTPDCLCHAVPWMCAYVCVCVWLRLACVAVTFAVRLAVAFAVMAACCAAVPFLSSWGALLGILCGMGVAQSLLFTTASSLMEAFPARVRAHTHTYTRSTLPLVVVVFA